MSDSSLPGDAQEAVTGFHQPVDQDGVVDLLRSSSRFDDPQAGRAEEQAYVPTPAGRLFATLVEPLRERRDVGFLICHSFAYEQLDLYPLELTFARRAASAGFPALSFQARGYGDSGGDFGTATLASQLRDALAAAEYFRRRAGIRVIVPVGARLGAAVALMVADRIATPGVVLWNPALEPGAYLDELLKTFSRSRIVGELHAASEAAGRSPAQLQTALAAGEDIDLFGYPLTRAWYEEAAAMHPLDLLDRAPRRALVVVVNPRTRGEAGETAARLRRLGSDVVVDHAEGTGRAQFGLGLWSSAGRSPVTYRPLFEDVAERTIRWAEEVLGPDAAAEAADHRATAERTLPSRSPVVASEDDGSPRPGSAIVEVPVYVESRGEQLGAVVAVPDEPAASVGVVLISGRARDRAHRNGLWVKLARTLAADGTYVLRLDYPGVGNSSGTPRIFKLNDPPSWAVEDACRFLLEHTPVRRILLVGTCYGARVVLDAAPKIPQVAAAAVVVAPVLARTDAPRRRLRVRAARLVVRNIPSARGAMIGEARRPKGDAHAPERRVDPAFAGPLERFLRRGRVYFLYGEQDLVTKELSFALDRLGLPASRYELDLVPGAIHTFRSLAMQALILEKLAAWCRRSAESVRELA